MRDDEKTLSDYPLGSVFLLGVFLVIVFWAAILIGWVVAHNTVAKECKKLGSFYVGNTVYECKVKTEEQK
jgi:TM2 domain-containing membrane protein YozV